MKDKSFALDLMKQRLVTNGENIKERSKPKEDRCLLKNFGVQEKQVG